MAETLEIDGKTSEVTLTPKESAELRRGLAVLLQTQVISESTGIKLMRLLDDAPVAFSEV